ncbi:hypothetical protein GJ688_17545, partial [Heliobacillus mobilis]|nr:hypothetical protein [Heliobacterium mobile]
MYKSVRSKAIVVFVITIMLCSIIPFLDFMVVKTYAADQPTGSGTANDPYLIASHQDLEWIRENYISKSLNDKYFVQTADIDLSGVDNFEPLDKKSVGFSGTYDGCWHTISNMKITDTVTSCDGYLSVGFFANLHYASDDKQGTVRNIKFSNVNINIAESNLHIGAIAANAEGTLENCYVSGTIVGGDDSLVGGLVGNSMANIISCYNAANVSAGNSTGVLVTAGGIAADCGWNLQDCWNSGNISSSSKDAAAVGGIVGRTNASLINCYSIGNVSLTGNVLEEDHNRSRAGGISGNALSNNLSSNYYLDGTCGHGIGMYDNNLPSDIGAEPKQVSDLKSALNSSDWGSADTWSKSEGQYPSLLTTANVPHAISADGGPGTVTVNWDKSKRAGAYRIYWSTESGSYNEENSVIAWGYEAKSKTIKGLVGGTTYYFVVKGVGDGNALSTESNEVSAIAKTDNTPPTWADGYPQARTVTQNSAEVLLQTDELGKAYYVVVEDGVAAPTAAQVKAGKNASGGDPGTGKKGSVNLTADTTATINITNLEPATNYHIYVVAEDGTPNLQASAVKVDIETTSTTGIDRTNLIGNFYSSVPGEGITGGVTLSDDQQWH